MIQARKKTLLFVLASLIAIAGAPTYAQEYTPKNTAIIFDIDDVILEKFVTSIFWKHKVAVGKAFLNPTLIWKSIKKFYKDKGSGEQWINFFEQNKQTDLAAMVRDLVETKQPIPGTVSVIEQLSDHGYPLFWGTNMGTNEFAQHKKRFDLFSRFTDGVAVSYADENNIIKKPNPRYYQLLLKKVPTNKKYLIFIDDKYVNVEAARQAGMKAIQFYNPEQLRAELQILGIL